MTTLEMTCKCDTYIMARGGHPIQRVHVNAFIGLDDKTETHTLGQCWTPAIQVVDVEKCDCGSYDVGVFRWCVVQIEWGRWARTDSGAVAYSFIQEVHRSSTCVVFRNGERLHTVDEAPFVGVLS